jgi:hypothetical protein
MRQPEDRAGKIREVPETFAQPNRSLIIDR